MSNGRLEFKIINGRLHVATPWPKKVEVMREVIAKTFFLNGDALHMICENGTAKYIEDGSDDEIWRGNLAYARGENRVERLGDSDAG